MNSCLRCGKLLPATRLTCARACGGIVLQKQTYEIKCCDAAEELATYKAEVVRVLRDHIAGDVLAGPYWDGWDGWDDSVKSVAADLGIDPKELTDE